MTHEKVINMTRINFEVSEEESDLIKKAKGNLSWHDFVMATLKTPIETKIVEKTAEIVVETSNIITNAEPVDEINYRTPISLGVFLTKIREIEPEFTSYQKSRNDILRYYHKLFPNDNGKKT